MNKENWHIENPMNCPLVHAMGMIGGKWKPIIIHMLSIGTHRFSELKKNIPPISQKVLTQQLRELEHDGLISRTVFPQVPPRVDYGLTELGEALKPIIDNMYQWGLFAQAQKP